MRRSVTVALSLLALGVFASTAGASYHLTTVNEVYPAATASQQFVELLDPVAEPFPAYSGPYYLVLYDGNGVLKESQRIHPEDGLRNSTKPFLLGRSAPRDAALEFTLPAAGGQLCFANTAPANAPVNCLGYGNIGVPKGDTGPLPGAGQSLQRLACGQIGVAAPTRDAGNASCGGGGSSDPDLTVKRKKTQDVDKVILKVETSEATTVTITARVSVPGASRVLKFKKVTRHLAANTTKRIRIRLKRSRKNLVKNALDDGSHPRARVKVVAKDAAGNTTTSRRKIKLKN